MTLRTDEYSSRRYEREAETTRNRLAQNLDELSDRLTPGQVFDEMLTYAKGGGGTFLRALSNAARENPVPSLLIGAGCMMFLSEKMGINRYIAASGSHAGAGYEGVGYGAGHGGAGYESAAKVAARKASRAAEGVAEGVTQATAAVGDTISSASRKVSETAQDLRDQASATGEQMKRGVQNAAETVRDYSSSISEKVTNTAARTGEQATRAGQQAKDAMMSFINEQPLLCAAIGLAVGAAVAAALPSTETEDELMGEASDAVKDAVGEVASDQFETAKAAATRVAQEAKSAAEREGLIPSAAADAARNLGEKITTVVSETTEAGKSEMREFAKAGDRT